ncbi:hypothetical protein K402DRAFT_328692 [Aulographum hederae CBS 113979]|uniref:Caffeine-induced death protein Cid2 n=1 Tax=Aulographum hederae CBS 113979 TaxID=1176131 RepID=A0A6G1H5W9_9PEZI|nr:hypothetical protein K402DRAFT_328692 [Aulographum hederae CBS 113979]
MTTDASASSSPQLTPLFCFHPSALQDFLRASRQTLDDSIISNINALILPSSSNPFSPASTAARTPSHRRPSASACAAFTADTLFPAWQARTQVLTYCSSVASSSSANAADPELIAREEADRLAREREVDERLDPYSARYYPQETRRERLERIVKNERVVEGIVRRRTWEAVTERCPGADSPDGSWEEAMTSWEKRNYGRGL